MSLVKPMRAAAATDEQITKLLAKFGYMFATPKLDGIRCSIQDQTAFSKSLKPIRNEFVQSQIGDRRLHGYDGELIVGNPTAEDVYRETSSGVMRIVGQPDFKLYVFDNCLADGSFKDRLNSLSTIHPHIHVVPQMEIYTLEDMHKYEDKMLGRGFEGIVLRDPTALYKEGKSTALQGESIKVKRFTDAEATIIGMEELQHNNNEAKTNELGRTQRSSHQKNKVGGNTLGKLICEDLESSKEFKIGVFKGLTAEDKQQIWNNQNKYIGKMVKYKSFKIGVKDKPRHAVFLGFRDKDDM